MTEFVTQIGEAFVGSGPEAAHLNTMLGAKGGPVETAWATALATPRQGHAAFLTTLRPGIPAKPMTLFVNKATLEDGDHSTLTWGPAQAGVGSGVLWAVADGIIEADLVDDLVLIAAVAGKANAITAMGALIFFWARLAYAVIYLAGIAWLRTVAWFASVIGMAIIAIELLKAI